MISFDDCEIKYQNHILFEKSWGKYDLIIGEKIISCYPGPADEKSFPEKKYDYKSQTIKANYSESDIKIHKLYNEVEKIRTSNVNYDRIKLIFEELESTKSQEWLLLLEICEIAKKIDEFLYKKIKNYLENLSIIRSDLNKLILDGLKII